MRRVVAIRAVGAGVHVVCVGLEQVLGCGWVFLMDGLGLELRLGVTTDHLLDLMGLGCHGFDQGEIFLLKLRLEATGELELGCS